MITLSKYVFTKHQALCLAFSHLILNGPVVFHKETET